MRTTPFRLVNGANDFNDDFAVLYAELPLDKYEALRAKSGLSDNQLAMVRISEVLTEIGPHFVRFIVVGLIIQEPLAPSRKSPHALSRLEVGKLVSKYIGVSQGYLADFSYESHRQFYVDLEIDVSPSDYDGTTRQRFIKILESRTPAIQAKILEGILSRFPVASTPHRTQELADEIRGWACRIQVQGISPVEAPVLKITSEVVERVLGDAEQLLRSSGATSAIDRVHTALHGYLEAVAKDAGAQIPENASMPQIMKALKASHPAFKDMGPRTDDMLQVLRSFGSIIDTLNPIRNMASVAHPNATLLPAPEAMLVINSVRTILHYLDQKISEAATTKTNSKA